MKTLPVLKMVQNTSVPETTETTYFAQEVGGELVVGRKPSKIVRERDRADGEMREMVDLPNGGKCRADEIGEMYQVPVLVPSVMVGTPSEIGRDIGRAVESHVAAHQN